MITSLKLVHWKSHEKTEIAFRKGTNVLVGPMGAGKTSVMDGLCFALYGTFPALKGKRVKLEELVMQRPQKHADAKVEATLEMGGKRYLIERTVGKEGSKAFLMQDGKLVETGPARVNEAVVRLLKTDYDLFARAIYADQNNIDAFLTLGKGERKAQIDELLGLDKFEKARAGAATALNKLKAAKSESERGLQQADAKQLKGELEALDKEIALLAKEQEEFSGALAGLEQDAKKKKLAVLELEKKQERHGQLGNELSAAKAKAESARENAQKASAQIKRKIPQEALKTAYEKARQELAQQEQLEKTIAQGKEKLGKISGELGELARRVEALSAETKGKPSAELEKEAGEVEAKLGKVEREEREISAKLLKLTAELALLQQAEKEKQERDKKTGALQDQIIANAAEMKKAGALDELLSKAEKLEAQQKHFEAALLETGDILKKLEGTGPLCPVCETPLEEHRAKHLVEKKKGILAESDTQLKGVSESLTQAQKEVQARQKLEEIAARLAEKLEEEKQQLGRLEKTLAPKQALEKEVDALGKQHGQLQDEARKLLGDKNVVSSLVKSAKEHGAAIERRKALEHEEKKHSQELEALAQKHSPQKRKELEEELAEIEKNERLYVFEKQHSEAAAKQNELEKLLEGLSFSREELDKGRQEEGEASRKALETKMRAESGEKMVKEKKVRQKEVGERVAQAQRQAQRLLELQNGVETLSKFSNALVEAQAVLRSELVQAVNEAAQVLWKSLYPYEDFQSVMLNASEDDYAVELLANTGEWTSVERSSGGERTCASLALRMAFAMVLTPNLSLLILDEPTHNLDSNAISSFCKTLREDIPPVVEQVFIITHDEALKEGANAAVYKVERDKDKGDKSTVEMLSAG